MFFQVNFFSSFKKVAFLFEISKNHRFTVQKLLLDQVFAIFRVFRILPKNFTFLKTSTWNPPRQSGCIRILPRNKTICWNLRMLPFHLVSDKPRLCHFLHRRRRCTVFWTVLVGGYRSKVARLQFRRFVYAFRVRPSSVFHGSLGLCWTKEERIELG